MLEGNWLMDTSMLWGILFCPLHNYRFNPKNGRNANGEGYFLKTFAVEIREDGIYACFLEGRLPGK